MKDNKLFLYIFISIIIHLVILLFFPLANKAGIAEEDNSQDFGFIQLVEYEPITQTSQDAGNEDISEDEIEQEEIEKNEEVEDEVDEEPEVNDEQEENETEESIEEEPSHDETSVKENESKDENNEQESKEVEEKPTKEVDSSENNEEVISSENSDVEMDINEEKEENDENDNNNDDENDSEEEKTSSNESNTDKSSEEEESAEEEEEKNAPPPPPTSGELIANTVTPQYPKDLIGDSKKGTVEFMVEIDKTGEINNLNMTNSSGIDQIDRTARLAIERGWEFKSYNLDYKIPITVDFNINDQGNPEINVNLGEVEFEEVNN